MGNTTIPYYGKDSDRLAKLEVAYNVLESCKDVLGDWPSTVATCAVFRQRIDVYGQAHKEAIHGDHRWIAKRNVACDDAGTTWQKIVYYLAATEQDNSAILEQMGVGSKPRRTAFALATTELEAPELAVINVDYQGAVRGSCPRERRRYTWEMWVTEGDPRVEEGWYHKASFGDGTQMDMDGFEVGKQYSFRCRVIGRDNKPSPWSLTVTIIVT